MNIGSFSRVQCYILGMFARSSVVLAKLSGTRAHGPGASKHVGKALPVGTHEVLSQHVLAAAGDALAGPVVGPARYASPHRRMPDI